MTTTTFHTPQPVTVEIRNAAGEVGVTLGPSTESVIEVTTEAGGFGFLEDLARAFSGRRSDGEQPPPDSDRLSLVRIEQVQRDGGDVIIVDTDPASRGWRGPGFRVAVIVPEDSGVRVATQSGDVRLTGRAGRTDIGTASGDVTTGDISAAALVRTASGDIRLAAVAGDLTARSTSGDVEVAHVGGSASVQTTSGGIVVHNPAADLMAKTVSGDVRVLDATRGVVEAQTVSGDVEIGLHRGSLAAINLASVSGNTQSDLEISDGPQGGAAGTGGGPSGSAGPEGSAASAGSPEEIVDIQVRTISGNIRLRRAVAV